MTLGDKSGADVAVRSVVVTLEPPERLVLGAFIEGVPEGGGVKEWAYWEGVFGPAELADHVRNTTLDKTVGYLSS